MVVRQIFDNCCIEAGLEGDAKNMIKRINTIMEKFIDEGVKKSEWLFIYLCLSINYKKQIGKITELNKLYRKYAGELFYLLFNSSPQTNYQLRLLYLTNDIW